MKKVVTIVYLSMLLQVGCAAPPTTSTIQQPTSTSVIQTKTSMSVPPIEPTAVTLTGCVDNTLRVRSGPGTDNEIIGRLKPQNIDEKIEGENFKFTLPACVSVIGRNQDTSWVMVSYEGQTGWVFADYIKIEGDVNQLSIVGDRPTVQQNKSLADIYKENKTTNMFCKDTQNKIGSYVTCKIARAYCSYQPSTSGNPTFCNDAPYPGNSFTLVVWDKDWSDLDGSCILVSGTVAVYNGKPQIEASSRSQVTACP